MKDTIRSAKSKGFFHPLIIAGGGLMRHHRKDRRGHGDGIASQHQFGDAVRHVEGDQAPSGMILAFANIVSTSRLICAMPMPINPGTISRADAPHSGIRKRNFKLENSFPA